LDSKEVLVLYNLPFSSHILRQSTQLRSLMKLLLDIDLDEGESELSGIDHNLMVPITIMLEPFSIYSKFAILPWNVAS